MKPRNKFIKALEKEFANNKKIKGLVLVGSSTGKLTYQASPHSDIEIYVIVNDEDAELVKKDLPHLVSGLGKVTFSYQNRWAGFSAVFDDLLRLELPIAKISELKSIFSRPKAQSVQVLLDKTNGKLENTLNERPEEINYEAEFKERVLDFWYMATVGAQYFKKGEFYNARSVLNILQSTLIKNYELLNNPKILLLESNKHIEGFLNEEQISNLKNLSPNYDKNNIKKAYLDIFRLFTKSCKVIEAKYKYSYNKIEDKLSEKLASLISSRE